MDTSLVSHPSLVKELHFSVVVFDTAPTGHTLRFLAMPTLFQKGLGKMTQLKSQFGPIFSSVSGPCRLNVVAVVSCLCIVAVATGNGSWGRSSAQSDDGEHANCGANQSGVQGPCELTILSSFVTTLPVSYPQCLRAGEVDVCVCVYCGVPVSL